MAKFEFEIEKEMTQEQRNRLMWEDGQRVEMLRQQQMELDEG